MGHAFAFLLATPFLAWIAFLAVMALKANQHKLTPIAKVFAYTHLYLIGYPLDFLWNVMASVPFLEPPKEMLFTARCKRHIEHGNGWRKAQAEWWCRNFLDPFDLNDRHCT